MRSTPSAKTRCSLISLAVAFPLLLGASAAMADYQVQMPLGVVSVAPAAPTGGGSTDPLAVAFTIDPNMGTNSPVVTGGVAPYTYAIELVGFSYDGSTYESCVHHATPVEIVMEETVVIQPEATCHYSSSTYPTRYGVYVAPRGGASFEVDKGDGWHLQYVYRVTDSLGATAATPLQAVQMLGH